MLIIATYVVSTETSQGRRRQHGVAKVCERVGQGLQKSVYNHQINQMQYEALERALLAVMDLDEDNLRLHRLANRTIRASSNKVSSAPSAPSATSRRPRQTKARAKTRQVRAAPKLISDVLERSPDPQMPGGPGTLRRLPGARKLPSFCCGISRLWRRSITRPDRWVWIETGSASERARPGVCINRPIDRVWVEGQPLPE
jgi:CRISPR-associated protein Cas2